MSTKIELKYRCTHCGKRNLYRTSHPDRSVRRCASCGRDFEVSPDIEAVPGIEVFSDFEAVHDIEVVPVALPAMPTPKESEAVRRVMPENPYAAPSAPQHPSEPKGRTIKVNDGKIANVLTIVGLATLIGAICLGLASVVYAVGGAALRTGNFSGVVILSVMALAAWGLARGLSRTK